MRHYGNVSEIPGEHLVRSTMEHGREPARLMFGSRAARMATIRAIASSVAEGYGKRAPA